MKGLDIMTTIVSKYMQTMTKNRNYENNVKVTSITYHVVMNL